MPADRKPATLPVTSYDPDLLALPASYRAPLKLYYGNHFLIPRSVLDALGWKSNWEYEWTASAEGILLIRLRPRPPRVTKPTPLRPGQVETALRPRTDGLTPGSPEAVLADRETQRARWREKSRARYQRQKEARDAALIAAGQSPTPTRLRAPRAALTTATTAPTAPTATTSETPTPTYSRQDLLIRAAHRRQMGLSHIDTVVTPADVDAYLLSQHPINHKKGPLP